MNIDTGQPQSLRITIQPLIAATCLVVIVIACVAGVADASLTSLPGDSLYGVKILREQVFDRYDSRSACNDDRLLARLTDRLGEILVRPSVLPDRSAALLQVAIDHVTQCVHAPVVGSDRLTQAILFKYVSARLRIASAMMSDVDAKSMNVLLQEVKIIHQKFLLLLNPETMTTNDADDFFSNVFRQFTHLQQMHRAPYQSYRDPQYDRVTTRLILTRRTLDDATSVLSGKEYLKGVSLTLGALELIADAQSRMAITQTVQRMLNREGL